METVYLYFSGDANNTNLKKKGHFPLWLQIFTDNMILLKSYFGRSQKPSVLNAILNQLPEDGCDLIQCSSEVYMCFALNR